jgi:uncharacterized protein YdiU (UPF0061 family)
MGLLGETSGNGRAGQVQLKGSRATPYSRMGDGRAVLRSSIREFLCSEAMHALGIPTTRALCCHGSPAPVRREKWKPRPWSPAWRPVSSASAISSISPRAGSLDELRALADYVIDRFYPECQDAATAAARQATPTRRCCRR